MSLYSSIQQRLSGTHGLLTSNVGTYVAISFNRYPGLYAGLTLVAAITAYALLLMFPLLALTGLLKTYNTITADVVDWLTVSMWMIIVVVACFISYRCVQIKISGPDGFALTEHDAPELFRLINQTKHCYGRPVIHRVIVTGNYELDITKVPRWILPVWSSNVLVIGLPVLNCHAPGHFACLIARRIGQFSKRDNMITNWLYQLRSIWPLYRAAFNKQRTNGTELPRWFLSVFTPAYYFLSTVIARKEELNADRYAMDMYNDEIVCQMISADMLYRYYLRHHYWPAVDRIIKISPKTRIAPYAKMVSGIRNRSARDKMEKLQSVLCESVPEWTDNMPSLKTRLASIGHDSPCMKTNDGEAAAEFYLGNLLENVTDEIDRQWLAGGFGQAWYC